MRPRFLADENLNAKIVAGLARREPLIDFLTARDAGMAGRSDPDVLAVAAREGRILVTHDRETMPAHFRQFIAGNHSPGLLIVSQELGVGRSIEHILLVWAATEAGEWINRVGFLPV